MSKYNNEGYKFQEYIVDHIHKTLPHLTVRETKGSGSKHGDADIIIDTGSLRLVLDCKYHEKYKHSSEIKKINKQKLIRGGLNSVGIILTGNYNEQRISMDISDFVLLLSYLKEDDEVNSNE